MNKKWIVLVSLFATLTGYSQEGKWMIYPCLGVDLGGAVPYPFSDIPDGSGGTPKPFPLLGIGMEIHLQKKWFIAFETNYHLIAFSARADVRSQPFYDDSHQNVLYFSGKTSADIELRMAEFPVVVNYRIGDNWAFLFGTYYARILEGSFVTKGSEGISSDNKNDTDNAILPGPASAEYDFSENIDNHDYGLLIGYRYNLNHKLFVVTRLHVGFKSIFKKEFDNIDYEMYQVRLSIALSYGLFSAKSS
jgi:hypothetical protein